MILRVPSEDTEDVSLGLETRARWAGGSPACPSPLPCSQWEGRPGLQEGGGLGRVGHVLVYLWQMSKGVCEGIYCVCVCVRERERLCMYVCMVNGALSDGLRVYMGRLCALCVCVNGRVSSV